MWLRFEPGAPLVRDSSGWNLPIHVNLVDRSSGMKGAKRKPLSASTRLVPARGAYRFADSKELSDALKAHEAREKRKSSADARMRSQVTMILKQQMRLLEEEFGKYGTSCNILLVMLLIKMNSSNVETAFLAYRY